ncbi:MAG: thioesterase [Eubacteriales bacterium]|nr:thioesterase [Eubacteriales bacterium]
MPALQMSKDYTLDIEHVDGRGMARPSAVVAFMQDLVTDHGEVMGLSGEKLAEHNGFWVLSRLMYQLERPLYVHETIQLTTLPREIRGASWYRDFVIASGNERIGYALTVWAVVNLETRRLMRPKTLGMGFEKQDTGFTETLKAIRVQGQQPCFDRVVRYSDIDINRHLNNVKAVDILSDAFGLENDTQRWVSRLQVNYIAESVCGTKLEIRRGVGANGSLCVSAWEGDKEKVQAEAVFSTR